MKRNVILCREEKGWDQDRKHPIQEAVLQTRGFSDGGDQEDGGKETICSLTGQREMHCPISVKVFVLLHNKGRDSV